MIWQLQKNGKILVFMSVLISKLAMKIFDGSYFALFLCCLSYSFRALCRKMYIHCVCAHTWFASLQLDWATTKALNAKELDLFAKLQLELETQNFAGLELEVELENI